MKFSRNDVFNLTSFCYMFATGSLYMTLGLFFIEEHLPKSTSFQMVSVFLAMLAIASIICGILPGRYLKYSTSTILGLLLYACGLAILLTPNFQIQIFSLVLCVIGAGIYIPATQVLLNRQFDSSSSRQQGVQKNYIIKNIGAISGLAATAILPNYHYNTIHLVSAGLLIIAACVFTQNKEYLFEDTGDNRWLYTIPTLLALAFLSFTALKYQAHTQGLLVFLGTISIFYITYLYFQSKDRSYLKYMMLVAFVAITYHLVNAVFFVIYGVFIKENLPGHINPSALLSLDPLIIIIFGWLMMYFFKTSPLSVLTRYKLGFPCLAFTMIAPIIGFYAAGDASISVYWLLWSIVFFGVAEFLLMPTLLIQTTELVPPEKHGLFMGFTRGYRGVGFALFSILCSKYFHATDPNYLYQTALYLKIFNVLALWTAGCGFAIFSYSYMRKRI